MAYQEGQHLQGSDGQVYVVHGGQPVRADSVPSAMPAMPANPKFPYEGPQAAVNVQNTQANVTGQNIDNRIKSVTAPYVIQKAAAESAAALAAADKAKGGQAAELVAQRMKDAAGSLNNEEALAAIARAKALTSNWSTGFLGKHMKGWGGTQADNLAAQMSTIAAGTSLNKMAELKQQSATGATGLGALSEKEGAMLRDSVGALDQTQDKDHFLEGLSTVEKHYRTMRAMQAGADPHHAAVAEQFGIHTGLHPEDARHAVDAAWARVQKHIEGYPPHAAQAAIETFNRDPNIQALKRAASNHGGHGGAIDFNDLPE